jgi:hypothetical protein
VTDEDARRILDDAQQSFQRLFAEAYTESGYEVVTRPGPDVLRLSTAIVDLDVVAPDTMEPGRTHLFARGRRGDARARGEGFADRRAARARGRRARDLGHGPVHPQQR